MTIKKEEQAVSVSNAGSLNQQTATTNAASPVQSVVTSQNAVSSNGSASATNGQTSGNGTASSSSQNAGSVSSSSERPTYEQGSSVTNAEQALAAWEASKPADYESSYKTQIDEVLNSVLNRKAFSYDPDTDPLYKSLLSQAQVNGKLAMDNATARAAALTGGYGSSYSQSAGQQAYQEELQKVNEQLPELYQMAQNSYALEGDRLSQNLAALRDADQSDYEKYRDKVSDYYTEGQYLYDKYTGERTFDYSKYRDTVSDWTEDRSFNYQKERDAVADSQWAAELAQRQLEASQDYQYKMSSLAQQASQFAEEMAYNKSRAEASDAQWAAEFALEKETKSQQLANAQLELELKQAQIDLDREAQDWVKEEYKQNWEHTLTQLQMQYDNAQLARDAEAAENAAQRVYDAEQADLDRASKERIAEIEAKADTDTAEINAKNDIDVATINANAKGNGSSGSTGGLSVSDAVKVISSCEGYLASKDNSGLEKYLDGLTATGAITEEQADSLYEKYRYTMYTGTSGTKKKAAVDLSEAYEDIVLGRGI